MIYVHETCKEIHTYNHLGLACVLEILLLYKMIADIYMYRLYAIVCSFDQVIAPCDARGKYYFINFFFENVLF